MCKLLRARLLQGHAATACTCSAAELGGLHGRACACACDAPPEAVARDPPDFMVADTCETVPSREGAGASAAGKAPAAAGLVRKPPALRAAEREVAKRGWRCLFIAADATDDELRPRCAPCQRRDALS